MKRRRLNAHPYDYMRGVLTDAHWEGGWRDGAHKRLPIDPDRYHHHAVRLGPDTYAEPFDALVYETAPAGEWAGHSRWFPILRVKAPSMNSAIAALEQAEVREAEIAALLATDDPTPSVSLPDTPEARQLAKVFAGE